MFIGEYNHNLDDKGRLAVPAKFRALLKEGAVVTKGLDNCLFLYPKEVWQKEAEKLSGLPVSQANARAYSRFFLAGAADVEFDAQGRINLPDYLRDFASLKKKCIIAGLYNRLEIWDEDSWIRYRDTADKESGHIAEELMF